MGRVAKSMLGAFLAANTIAGVGAYQGTKELAENPFLTQGEIETTISHRQTDNLSRALLGDQGDIFTQYGKLGIGEDDSIDASLSRFFGNQVLNRSNVAHTDDKYRLPKIVALASMAATYPGSYIGSEIGYHTADITAE